MHMKFYRICASLCVGQNRRHDLCKRTTPRDHVEKLVFINPIYPRETRRVKSINHAPVSDCWHIAFYFLTDAPAQASPRNEPERSDVQIHNSHDGEADFRWIFIAHIQSVKIRTSTNVYPTGHWTLIHHIPAQVKVYDKCPNPPPQGHKDRCSARQRNSTPHS